MHAPILTVVTANQGNRLDSRIIPVFIEHQGIPNSVIDTVGLRVFLLRPGIQTNTGGQSKSEPDIPGFGLQCVYSAVKASHKLILSPATRSMGTLPCLSIDG